MAIDEGEEAHLKKLGLCLRKIRMERGMTLFELGCEIDKDAQSISRVEMGKINPSELYLRKIFKGLAINPLVFYSSLYAESED
jgi:putative transcriptional regulator